MNGAKDRRQKLADESPAIFNGIDFAVIANAQRTTLEVHFLTGASLANTVTSATITGGQTIPAIPVTSMTWSADTLDRPLLILNVEAPGDVSTYTLSLTSPVLDPYFSRVQFRFAAGGVSVFDCQTPAAVAQAPIANVPPIDYLAKDFLSFRKALSDFSTLAYPNWQERSEADFGVMFMEALCALADDLSYQQDRIAAEAYLATATERLSVVRRARLVDYEPAPALAATATLQFTMAQGMTAIPPGLAVSAGGPDGTAIDFETGTGLADTTQYPANSAWNAMKPYWWDDASRVLPIGATEMWVCTHGLGLTPNLFLLLDTAPAEVGQPNIRETIQIRSADEETDQLYDVPLTHIVFESALGQEHDLGWTVVKGNLVPATQGLRHTESFAIGSGPAGVPAAVTRTGPNQTELYVYTLGNAPLTWLATGDDPSIEWAPEIQVTQQSSSVEGIPQGWTWVQSILDAAASAPAYTIDPVRYTRLPSEIASGVVQLDYDGSSGDTIRFGFGDFGEIPAPNSVFTVVYRAGAGASGNVAADSITSIVSTGQAGSWAIAVNNPFPATGGADAESLDSVRQLAPYAFQSTRFNASRPADFVAAAQSLPWVERAGCTIRSTGSWLTAFTTAEPFATELPTDDQMRDLTALLNRYRIAGCESCVVPPCYVSLNLRIAVIANPSAFNSDVAAAILKVLGTGTLPNGSNAFFAHANFTFGQPLERSALEAAIQGAQGVAGVSSIRFNRQGSSAPYIEMTDQVQAGIDRIIRVDNDLRRPDAGSILVTVTGGK